MATSVNALPHTPQTPSLGGSPSAPHTTVWTTLSRAATAREAIAIMDNLTQTYGYESDGESYGVGDSEEVSRG